MFFPKRNESRQLAHSDAKTLLQGISVFTTFINRQPTEIGSQIRWGLCSTRNQSDECVGLCGTTGGVESALCCAINPNYISKQINPMRCGGGGSAPANQSTLRILHGRGEGGGRVRVEGWRHLLSVATVDKDAAHSPRPLHAPSFVLPSLYRPPSGRPAIIHAEALGGSCGGGRWARWSACG